MTNNDFVRVQSLLKASFPRIALFETDDSTDLVFNVLNRYDSRDVLKGVKECIEEAQYPPTIHDLVQSIERCEKNRREDERNNASQAFHDAVRCVKCNDSGYLIIRRDDGYEGIRPCVCAAARARFPWAFVTEEEHKKWIDEERRKGRKPPTEKPGMSAEYAEEHAGEIKSISPGGRPPGPNKEFKHGQTV